MIVKTVALLLVSNVFMTFAWYGHLRYKHKALWIVVLASWLIAFFEYCFQVPANRLGSAHFTTAQLKTIQEVITLLGFCVFSVLYLRKSSSGTTSSASLFSSVPFSLFLKNGRLSPL